MRFSVGNVPAISTGVAIGLAQGFPAVWAVAERYLAIPATSAPSERAFSAAGNIISMKRCRLNADLVAEMLFLRENLDMTDRR